MMRALTVARTTHAATNHSGTPGGNKKPTYCPRPDSRWLQLRCLRPPGALVAMPELESRRRSVEGVGTGVGIRTEESEATEEAPNSNRMAAEELASESEPKKADSRSTESNFGQAAIFESFYAFIFTKLRSCEIGGALPPRAPRASIAAKTPPRPGPGFALREAMERTVRRANPAVVRAPFLRLA